jgi:replicative DNA helicase
LPKSYIFEIASNWKKIGISNAKQAYEYALQVNQPKNYETHSHDKRQNNRGRQNQFLSKEKTPKWLQNRDDKEENKDINDDTLEEDRQAFLEKLNQKWKEEDN